MNKFVSVEQVLDVNDINRLWYYIPGFNGYEISNDLIIRSMKHYKKYPFGILIQKKSGSDDPVYELSNDNNERVCIKLSQIVKLSQSNMYNTSGYPRRTYMSDNNPRNQSYFVRKKSQSTVLQSNTLNYPKFNTMHYLEE